MKGDDKMELTMSEGIMVGIVIGIACGIIVPTIARLLGFFD